MDVDEFADAYLSVVRRVSTLAVAHSDQLDRPVPGCPDWSARDVIRHLTGLAEDVVAGSLAGYASPEWTTDHIRRFEGVELGEMLAAWSVAAGQMPQAPPIGSVSAAAMAFGDAVVHEADLREVLDPDSEVPHRDVGRGLKSGVARWRRVLERAAAPPLRMIAVGHREFVLGDPSGRPVTSVEGDGYVLFRTLYGRRTRDEARALAWTGDPQPFLDAGLPYPFEWSAPTVRD